MRGMVMAQWRIVALIWGNGYVIPAALHSHFLPLNVTFSKIQRVWFCIVSLTVIYVYDTRVGAG